MANRYMTGTTCGTGEIITFIGSDTNVSLNDFFQLSTGRCIQITSTGNTTNEFINQTLLIEFASCAACLATYSASTGGNSGIVCQTNCSGATFTINPLHPVYTDNQGHGVTQINAVTIGGNGLNA
jgi:hypothetical protein